MPAWAHGLSVGIDPITGQVYMAQSLYVAGEALLWLIAVVLGLVTAWLVLP